MSDTEKEAFMAGVKIGMNYFGNAVFDNLEKVSAKSGDVPKDLQKGYLRALIDVGASIPTEGEVMITLSQKVVEVAKCYGYVPEGIIPNQSGHPNLGPFGQIID